jgi:hypothetical protein
VKAAGIAGQERKPDYKNDECCDLKSAGDSVNFDKDCHSADIFAKNWTALAFPAKR